MNFRGGKLFGRFEVEINRKLRPPDNRLTWKTSPSLSQTCYLPPQEYELGTPPRPIGKLPGGVAIGDLNKPMIMCVIYAIN